MNDIFNIYVHHLADGHQEKIEKRLPPTFLAVHGADLSFQHPVSVQGMAEVADGALIVRLMVQTQATMQCMICNREVLVKVSIPDVCHTEELSDIERGAFNIKEMLREEILLALPSTVECNKGNCPEREGVAKYFSNNKQKEYHPFEDL